MLHHRGAFLTALGTDDIPHGSRVDSKGESNGSFLDHLSGCEEQLREWGCEDAVCWAGLYHSVYGTGRPGYTVVKEKRAAEKAIVFPRL